jgi:hypothetical protein
MRVFSFVSVVFTMTMMVPVFLPVSFSLSMPMKYLPKSMAMMSVSTSMATDFNVDSFGVVTVFDKFWHVDFKMNTEK